MKTALKAFITVLFFLSGSFFIDLRVKAATITWIGGTDTNWETDENWSGGTVPGIGDEVIIDSNVTINISSPITVSGLILGNSGGTTAPVLNFNYDAITSGAFIISGGDLTVYSGGTITHTDTADGSIGGRIFMNITSGNAVINGTVNADEKGYVGGPRGVKGYGTGGGFAGSNLQGGGAGYGGIGADSTTNAGGVSYGAYLNPIDLGSGGGGGGSTSNGTKGGDGGGSVKIVASGSITVDGTISMNGGVGVKHASYTNRQSGGGSGGTVNLEAGIISGTGTITANGGNGYTETGVSGGGAGGRILIKYATTNTFSGTITAALGAYGTEGENGTILYLNSSSNDLILKSDQSWYADPLLEGKEQTFNDMYLQGCILTLKGYYTTSNDGVGFNFNLNSINIDGTSSINGDGYGYAGGAKGTAGNGSGGGQPSYTTRAGGGAYGGYGADADTDGIGLGGYPYGEHDAPVDLGSGGAGGGSPTIGVRGGNGGGAIKIAATGTITINGTISMNGEDGYTTAGYNDRLSGGGSGGSVYLIAKTVMGSGTVTANGGNGYSDNGSAGGGSGGRIAIRYSTNYALSDGAVAADVGTGGVDGKNGTVIFVDTTNNALYIRNAQIWYADPSLEGSKHLYRDFRVQNNATLTLVGYYTSDSDGIGFDFSAKVFEIELGAAIEGDGYGYAGGPKGTVGEGTGASDGHYKASGGASYGGSGASSTDGGSPGLTYGSEEAPIDLGSGAGGGGSNLNIGPSGGNGGSAIKISATDDLVINGILSMDGTDGTYEATDLERLSGGGSGGSIYLIGKNLTGAGTITANGGNGYSGTGESGAGGGGRIAIYFTGSSNWTGNALTPVGAAHSGSYGTDGENGTVIVDLAADGYIVNLENTLDAVLASDWDTIIEQGGVPQRGIREVGIKSVESEIISDFQIFFKGDRDFAAVSADSDFESRKSFMHVPDGYSNLDGYDSAYPTFDLYIPKGVNDQYVHICPDADDFSDITDSCISGYSILSTDSRLTTEIIDEQEYWVVSGMTSTGGYSISTNHNPISSEQSLLGAGNIYANQAFNLVATYSDDDGASDLDRLYLKIQNPDGDDIEYYALEGVDGYGLIPNVVSGGSNISSITYDRDTGNPDSNSIQITWHITINSTWSESNNIEFGVKATDDVGDYSLYNMTDGNYNFIIQISSEEEDDDEDDDDSDTTGTGNTVTNENEEDNYEITDSEDSIEYDESSNDEKATNLLLQNDLSASDKDIEDVKSDSDKYYLFKYLVCLVPMAILGIIFLVERKKNEDNPF